MARLMFLSALAVLATAPASAQSPQAAPHQASGATAPAEKLICKRKLKTGSLVGYERTCHTRAEWQRLADATREAWQELQGSKGSTRE